MTTEKSGIAKIMVTLMLVEMLSSFELSMVVTALPTIIRQFNDIPGAGWLIASFALVQAGTAAIVGRLGDLFGRKRLLIVVVCLCVLGSLVSGTATDLNMIIVGRAIQGASGAILPLSYGIAREVAPRRSVPFWVGCLTGMYVVGTGLGFVLGGVLTQIGSWQLLFHFTAGYAALVLIPLIFLIPATRPTTGSGRLDLIGGLMFIPSVALILYGLTVAPRWGWTTPGTLAFILAGAAGLLFWFAYEWRHPDPLIDVRLLARAEVALANICFALVGLSLGQAPVVFMLLAQQPVATGVGVGLGAAAAGLLKIPANLLAAAVSPLAGWASGRFGGLTAVLLGAMLASTALSFAIFWHGSLWEVLLGSIVSTVATTILLTAVPNVILELAPRERLSESTGLAVVVKGIFASVGVQISTMLLATSQAVDPASGARYPTDAAYQLCFVYLAACPIVLSALVLGYRWRVRHERPLAAAA